MQYRSFLLVFVLPLLLLCPVAHARIIIFTDTEKDDQSARMDCCERMDVARRAVMLERLERMLLDGVKSKAQLVDKYGPPKNLDAKEVVRPLGAAWEVGPENVRGGAVKGLQERAKYFELHSGAGMQVYFSPEGKPYLPAILFFKVAENMPEMDDVKKCDERLKWEASRLKATLELVDKTEDELTPSETEIRKSKEAEAEFAKRREEFFRKLRKSRESGDKTEKLREEFFQRLRQNK